MSKQLQLKKGFSLMEAMVALAVLSMLIAMVMPGIGSFIRATGDDFVNMCVWESAVSELRRIKSNPNQIGRTFTYRCGALNVTVNSQLISGTLPNTPPPSGQNQRACAIVRVNANAQGRTATISGPVCRFF